MTESKTYRTAEAAQIVGISYDCIWGWARSRLVVPSLREGQGRGVPTLYSNDDLVVLAVVRRLREHGLPVARIRTLVADLRTLLESRPTERPGVIMTPTDVVAVRDVDKFPVATDGDSMVIDVGKLRDELMSRCNVGSTSTGP